MEANRSFADHLPMNADFGPIDLARAEPFSLGALVVRPATREVRAGDEAETLQPRIMQVLVALASRVGEVISRDELIRTCWDGQVVGDDAINRCIAKLRQLGETHGAFEIATIARVGYRLDAAEAAATQHAATPVLAVLPFENLSSDPEMQFFSDGVSEEILVAAARIEGLRTIGRATSFFFRGAAKVRAAAELKATHVLDGSVRRSGDRVRIAAQLTETQAHTILWSQNYERSLVDVFVIQDEIASEVAVALHRAFAASPQVAVDPLALDCFLQARDRYRNSHARASDAVLALLEEAVVRAPDYAPAWALLARVREMNAMERRAKDLPLHAGTPREALKRALALDPACVPALVSLAQLEPSCGRFMERERLFLQARAAAPGDAEAMNAMSFFLQSVGRCREATALAASAHEIDPLSGQIIQHYALLLSHGGAREDAERVIDDALRRRPDSLVLMMTRVWLAVLAGDWALVDHLLPSDRAEPLRASWPLAARVIDGIPTLRDPTPERRAAWIAGAERRLAETGSMRLGDISGLAMIGETEAAFSLCARASFERFLRPIERFDPYDIGPVELFSYECSFHNDPRFVDLCAKLGLARYWVATDRWSDCADTTPYDFREACRRAVNAGAA